MTGVNLDIFVTILLTKHIGIHLHGLPMVAASEAQLVPNDGILVVHGGSVAGEGTVTLRAGHRIHHPFSVILTLCKSFSHSPIYGIL